MWTMNKPIFLVGYRGSGKTTVGRLLAEKLNRPFVDMDFEIESEAGGTIKAIFKSEGEAGFRRRESDMLRKLASDTTPRVIATGGGVILAAENRECLKSQGFVVWLRADPQVCFGRIQGDTTTADRRPTLTTGGFAEVEELIAKRTPMYAEVTHLTVDTSGRTPNEIVGSIHKFLKSQELEVS